MNIIINKPEIKETNGKVRFETTITYGKEKKKLFYEYDKSLAQFITDERIDCFLVPILPYAMIKAKKDGEIRIVSEVPMSQKLYTQLVNFYLPILKKNIGYFGPVNIDIEISNEKLPSANACGTGVSGGIDSSYTISKYLLGDEKNIRLTHGVFFNLGIYSGFDSSTEKTLEENSAEICKEVGLNYVQIKANTCVELYGKAHGPIVPSIMMGGILSLQKLFSLYYMSADYSAEEQRFDEGWAARYDWLNNFAFSTENTQFYPAGLEATRMEKIKYIKDFSFTYKHIAVCIKSSEIGKNCSKCAKCTETMSEFDSIGVLDKYKDVFDVDLYRSNPSHYIGYVIMKKWGNEEACRDVLIEYKKRGFHIPMSARLGAVKKWISRGFKSDNPNREKVEELI